MSPDNPNRLYLHRLLVLLLVIWGLAGCQSSPEPSAGDSPTIECLLAYRSSVTVPIEREERIELSEADPQQRVAFDSFVFQARYDPGNAPPLERSFRIWVMTGDDQHLLMNQLFQMPATKDIQNQFLGQHGFTGLAYLYHPVTAAELQYTCQVR